MQFTQAMKFKSYHIAVIFFIFVFLNTGCVSDAYNPAQTVKIFSNPPDAEVYINGAYYGKTPLFTALRKRNNYTIEIKKEGYKTQVFKIYSTLKNAIFIIGVLDGAAYELSQDRIDANLEPLENEVEGK